MQGMLLLGSARCDDFELEEESTGSGVRTDLPPGLDTTFS